MQAAGSSPLSLFLYSDLECDLHLLTVHGKKKPKLLGLSQLSTIRYSLPAQFLLAVAKTVTLVASNAAFPLPPIDFNESQISDFY